MDSYAESAVAIENSRVRKKVLHIADSLFGGGAESVFRDTVRASKEAGYRTSVVTSNEKRGLISYIFSFPNFLRLFVRVWKVRPEIVHIQNYYHFLSPSILLVIYIYKRFICTNVRVVFTAHDYHLIYPNSGLQYFVNRERRDASPSQKFSVFRKYDMRGWFYSSLKCCQHVLSYRLLGLGLVFDIIISPSVYLKDTFEAFGIKSKFVVIRNPLPGEIFVCKGSDSFLLSKSINRLRLVFVGRVVREKGVLEFIRDSGSLNLGFDLDLMVVGNGDRDYLEELRAEAQKHKRFFLTLLDGVDRTSIPKIFSSRDVYVLPSTWRENAPLGIMEAAISGLPVLTKNIGGMREMAMLTSCFYLYSDKGTDTLYSALIKVKDDVERGVINSPTDYSLFSFDFYRAELKRVYECC